MKPSSPFTSIAIALLLMLTAAGCSRPSSTPVGEPVDIVRLDHAIVALAGGDSVLDSAAEDGADAWLYAARGIMPGSLPVAVRDSLLRVEAGSSAFRVFAPDVDRLLPPLDDIARQLRLIDSIPDRVYATVSPYSQSVITVDTVIIIALNHYLGSDYDGYSSFPDYRRLLKTPERIPLDVAEAWLTSRYPFADSVVTPMAFQRLVYEGAILAASADELRIPDGAELIGWTEEQWADAVAHESEAWTRLVAGEMLFSEDPALISRLTAPAPATPDISPDSPGRLGRFLGLRIVRSAVGSGRWKSASDILASRAYLDRDIFAPYARSRR